METVQIQCGSCKRVMAVSFAHLGSQVHCPHCQAIVQAPPPRPTPRAADVRADDGDTESIFAAPEMTDDIFNSGPSGPLVEMPLEQIKSSPAEEAGADSGTLAYIAPKVQARKHDADNDSDERTEAISPPSPPWTESSTVAEAGPGDEGTNEESNLETLAPRRVAKSSSLAPILLIFLIPYALLATGVIVYLFLQLNQGRAFDPLERLPDPNPKDGGPRLQVAHNLPLPDKLKTHFGQTLRIGALEVTPVKVQRTAADELVLILKVKNVSKDQIFSPVSLKFMKASFAASNPIFPYTYLDWSQKKLYGGYPETLKGAEGKEEPFNGEIGPGQDELVRLVTDSRYKADVPRLAASQENLVWRVQMRRGFVDVRGSQVSATAVVGVEFNAGAIETDS